MSVPPSLVSGRATYRSFWNESNAKIRRGGTGGNSATPYLGPPFRPTFSLLVVPRSRSAPLPQPEILTPLYVRASPCYLRDPGKVAAAVRFATASATGFRCRTRRGPPPDDDLSPGGHWRRRA